MTHFFSLIFSTFVSLILSSKLNCFAFSVTRLTVFGLAAYSQKTFLLQNYCRKKILLGQQYASRLSNLKDPIAREKYLFALGWLWGEGLPLLLLSLPFLFICLSFSPLGISNLVRKIQFLSIMRAFSLRKVSQDKIQLCGLLLCKNGAQIWHCSRWQLRKMLAGFFFTYMTAQLHQSNWP